jgi:hypothetical protein
MRVTYAVVCAAKVTRVSLGGTASGKLNGPRRTPPGGHLNLGYGWKLAGARLGGLGLACFDRPAPRRGWWPDG